MAMRAWIAGHTSVTKTCSLNS